MADGPDLETQGSAGLIRLVGSGRVGEGLVTNAVSDPGAR